MGVKAANVDGINFVPAVEQGVSEEEDMKVKKYLRGEAADLGALQDKKLKGQLAVREELYGKSAQAAAKAEKWLMPSEGGYLEVEGIEKTWRIRQEAIAREVDILSSRKQFDIVLPELGPYTLDLSLSGRYMVAAGRKGHLALLDMKNMDLIKEFQVRETVRDVVFLHNQKLFAAAQKNNIVLRFDFVLLLFQGACSGNLKLGSTNLVLRKGDCMWIINQCKILENKDLVQDLIDVGKSIKFIRNGDFQNPEEHGAAARLQFLNKHFLLTSINKLGQLHFQDITTGEMVGNFRTGLGRSDAMEVNPFNNVTAVGHSGGTVSMWKPTSAAPLVKMLCHRGPVTALAFHSNGHLMATAGMERKIKLWDLRKFEVLQTLPGHAKTMNFSQKGLLATATGSYVQILGDFSGSQEYSRYMGHSMAKGYQIRKVLFRPYEDVLAIGHSMGWSSILIPGSGEPNFDTWVANPFETRKQRNEKEVRSLLDKLPPETIMLDPTKIGSMRPTRKKEHPTKKEREEEKEAAVEGAKSISFKKKTKGRSKSSKVARRSKKL
ncbi:putative U3 small nucleolar RNA-associated protein 7 [Sesamum angolense]|uniref:U3 small nucleolar RNA-associated protein 7 n=1 Tax=Sesamum angolense TaxID=2727404 RepID=A0AAE2BZZ4_9LAMI|nr:putative U3 small nucleolar RNA-associated protein 7 [Sesamum angolense]